MMPQPKVMPKCAAALVAHRYPTIETAQKAELTEVISAYARSVSHARAALESFSEAPSADDLKFQMERTTPL